MRNNVSAILCKKYGNDCPKFANETYKILGIGKKAFRQFVNNKKQPTLDELQRIANWLGVNPKELINF
jgi:plasmid maintenance system antidote protein VapI